ncbi:response regulator transcription factor [Tianweitania populi]|uniref:DNA-binding response regulator n=1 Tax=Tianweitania populi TaxID=1607949 RepID=A0A8J3GMH6_9HYPH|nr:response regulator transcription factor [Tianweitania populi]GHD24430.1 DNA-binding response regulator [Tianweitania populi]
MTQSAVKILVVDDEPAIRKLLRVGLTAEGYALIEAPNAREALVLVKHENPDLILLDLGLPDMSGHDLLERWRAEPLDLPIIILSSRTDEAGIVRALELGADDYVTKPFGTRELVARIRVALRHKLQQQGERPIFQTGDLSVDLVKRIVRLAGREVKLSPKEYDILRILVQHAGKVITHQHLLKQVWGGPTDVQYLRVYVRQLRQKIEQSPDDPHYITTETGVGYRLREADPDARWDAPPSSANN